MFSKQCKVMESCPRTRKFGLVDSKVSMAGLRKSMLMNKIDPIAVERPCWGYSVLRL